MSAFDPSGFLKSGHVNSKIYSDPKLFELEMENVFGKAWVFVGHVSQVPDPGSFVTARLGREPVLIVRGADEAVRVFYNRCTHRGAKLCMLYKGQQKRFTCPYHAWTYDLQGDLRSVPKDDEYGPDFEFPNYSLKQVARVDDYRGFIFASADPDAIPLEDFLGVAKTSIDDIVDRSPTQKVTLSTPLRHRYAANWKYVFENLNDTLHAGVAHAISAKAANTVLRDLENPEDHPTLFMIAANAKPIEYFEELEMHVAEMGHSFFGGHMGAAYRGELYERYHALLADTRGADEAKRILSVDRHLTLIYPSSTWHGRFQTVRMINPISPTETEVVTFLCRLDGAPDEVYENALAYCNFASSCMSTVITDDLEIYESAQRGADTLEGLWLPMVRAQGRRSLLASGTAHHATSEVYIRNQYSAWQTYLMPDSGNSAEVAQDA